MRLIKPSFKYQANFWRGLLELRRENKEAFREFGDFKNATEFVSLMRQHERGEHLPKGWIPYFVFWLIEGGVVVGQAQLRPTLTKFLRNVGGQIGYAIFLSRRRRGYGSKILALTLKKARALGLKKIIITCDENNLPSKKIIEANGGVLEKKGSQGKGLPKKLVYWINLN